MDYIVFQRTDCTMDNAAQMDTPSANLDRFTPFNPITKLPHKFSPSSPRCLRGVFPLSLPSLHRIPLRFPLIQPVVGRIRLGNLLRLRRPVSVNLEILHLLQNLIGLHRIIRSCPTRRTTILPCLVPILRRSLSIRRSRWFVAN